MAEPLTDQTEALIPPDHEEPLEQSEDKQAVIEVARLVTETEMEHGIRNANTNECPSTGLDTTPEGLETNPTTEEVQEVGRGHPGSDLAINIMSHMEISRLIANVVKRMQEDGSQSGVNTHNLFHMENLLKQIVTNQNTITINQNSLLRNQQAILQKVDILNSLMIGVMGEGDPRLAEKATASSKANYNTPRGPMSSPRPGAKRSFGMDGTAALVQAAEQVALITGSPGSVGMSVGQTLNGVSTTAVISQDGNVNGEQRTTGDEEQAGFGTPSQATTVLSTISPSAIYLAAGSMSPDQLMQQSKTVSEVQLIRLKTRSQSVGNFAVHLVREMFKPHELMSKNVSGTRNKNKLDPERVAKIRKYVFDMFPTSEFEEDKVWSDCRKAMDEFLRRPNKRKNQERLSHDGLDYGMSKKDKLTDNQVMGTP